MQTLLVLACLRKDETFAELIAGFGSKTATAWRYLTGTVALLAARAPKLRYRLVANPGASQHLRRLAARRDRRVRYRPG